MKTRVSEKKPEDAHKPPHGATRDVRAAPLGSRIGSDSSRAKSHQMMSIDIKSFKIPAKMFVNRSGQFLDELELISD